MKPKIKNSLFLIVFITVIIGMIFLDKMFIKKQEEARIPPGWQIIRPPHEISSLVFQGNLLWTGGKDGVFAIDRVSGKMLKELKEERSFSYVRGLCVDNKNLLWIAHAGGLTVYDGKSFLTYDKTNTLPDNRLNAVFEDSKGKLWVGTWFGAVIHEGGDWKGMTTADGLLDNSVNVIFEDKDGGMWFGSYAAPAGGVSYLKDGEWQYFSTTNGLPHNNINTIVQDRDGYVWIGTGLLDRGGAAKLKKTADGWQIEQIFKKRDGLAGAKVRSIFQDKNGYFWFGSEYNGVAIFYDNQKKIITKKNGLSDPEVKVILEDDQGDLWLGTRDGLTWIKQAGLSF
jgi:ligand-binding sensor domain-containing protein|tara:strand:- start:4656 stop:5675 length:1020 start_codon:yes stop_codon:yes gene_type:complete